MFDDTLNHGVCLFNGVVVGKSHDPNTLTQQEVCSGSVIALCGGIQVMQSVQLNCESYTRTVEIQNIVPNTVLSSKFASLELLAAQIFPQMNFSTRSEVAEVSSSVFETT